MRETSDASGYRSTGKQENVGRVEAVRGSVVDACFHEQLPAINSELRTGAARDVVIEVATQFDPHTVRGIALKSIRGLARGALVWDLERPLRVPVGQQLLGLAESRGLSACQTHVPMNCCIFPMTCANSLLIRTAVRWAACCWTTARICTPVRGSNALAAFWTRPWVKDYWGESSTLLAVRWTVETSLPHCNACLVSEMHLP